MKTYLRTALAIATIAISVLLATPAQAQATRTWVSGVGDDANPCSRTAPCKTFAGAISKTAAGGEIDCLDSGGFGGVTITKSITLMGDGVVGGVLVSGTNGITVSASSTDVVTLSGLDIEGLGTGISGVSFLSGAALHVYKTHIRDFRGGGSGITFTPSGSAELDVADSYITDNGSTTTTGGILIKPTAAASVTFSVVRSQIENNSLGIRSDSSVTTGTVRGLVRDSLVAGSTHNGIAAFSAATVSALMVDHTSVTGNSWGLVVNGSNASQFVTNSSVTANETGLFVNGAGSLLSYKTNAVDNNTVNGAFTGTIFPE